MSAKKSVRRRPLMPSDHPVIQKLLIQMATEERELFEAEADFLFKRENLAMLTKRRDAVREVIDMLKEKEAQP